MPDGDKHVSLAGLKAVYDIIDNDLDNLKSALDQVTDSTGFVRDVPLSAFDFRDGRAVRHANGLYGTSTARSEGMNFIPVSGAKEIVLTMVKVTGGSSNFGLAFYTGESNSTFIADSGIMETTNASEVGYDVRTIPVPSGANYFRTTWFSSTSETYGQLYDEFSCRIIVKSSSIDERFDGIDERLDGIDERLDGIDDQVSASDTHLNRLDEIIDNNERYKSSASSFLYRRNLPSYYITPPNNPVDYDDSEYIQKRINEIPAGRHFIFVTDVHWDSNQNAKKTNDLIQYVRSRIGDVDVVFGGDVLNKNDTKYQAVNIMRSYLNESIDAYGDKFIPAIGNHDVNSVKQWNRNGTPKIDPDIWYPPYNVIAPIWLDHLNSRAVFRDESEKVAEIQNISSDTVAEYNAYFRFNYYINSPEGITYIVYNTGAGGKFVRDNFGYDSRSSEIFLHYGWLYNTLMQVPPGNDVVLVGHQSTNGRNITDNNGPLTTFAFANVARMMSSFLRKQTTRLYLGTIIENKWVHETYPVYDFANAPNVGKVFMLQGHWHQDFVIKFNAGTTGSSATPITVGLWNRTDHFSKSNGDVPIITTVADKYFVYKGSGDNPDGDDDETEIDDENYDRTPGTVTEQAFDVVTITESGVVTTRFGGAETTDDLRREMIFED